MELLSFRKLCMKDEGHRIWKCSWTSQCSPLELFCVEVREKCKGGEKIVKQLEDSGLLKLRRSVRIFSFCSWLLLHYCMATCTRMTRTNRLSHVSIPFHMVAWKSMQFTLRPCGPSKRCVPAALLSQLHNVPCNHCQCSKFWYGQLKWHFAQNIE
jgi:hypothetical protein